MEHIDVLAVFSDGNVKPIAYRIGGKQHKVKEVTRNFSYYEGNEQIFNIFVIDEDDKTMELIYWPMKNHWAKK